MKKYIFTIICFLSWMLWAKPNIQLGVESQTVEMHETFLFQISVQGADKSQVADFPENPDFQAVPLPPSENQSTSIQIINGHLTRHARKEKLYRFQLTPKHPGHLYIPSLIVKADGKEYKTERVPILVGEGEAISNLFFELTPPKKTVYVGEPLMLEWKCWIGRNDVRSLQFQLPLLNETKNFSFPAYAPRISLKDQSRYRMIPLPDGTQIPALFSTEERNGLSMICLTFRRPALPLHPGHAELFAGSATFQIAAKGRRNSPFAVFNDMDDDFGGFFSRGKIKTLAIQGNKVEIDVKPLPTEGKPKNFTGILGKFQMRCDASSTEVNLGDPILCTLTIKGLPWPDAVRCRPFSLQKNLLEHFKLSNESDGEVLNGILSYQCTLRAKDVSTKEIPAISLAYFDTETGKYAVISSEPIPLQVHASEKVTLPGSPNDQPLNSSEKIKIYQGGISHNYRWGSLLAQERLGFRNWGLFSWKTILTLGAPLLWLLALLGKLFFSGHESPEQKRARLQAHAGMALLKSKEHLEATGIYEAMFAILRHKFSLPEGVSTIPEILAAMNNRKISAPLKQETEALLQELEAARFAGLQNGKENLQQKCLALLNKL